MRGREFLEQFNIPETEAEHLEASFYELIGRLGIEEERLEDSLRLWEAACYDGHLDGVRSFVGCLLREACRLMRVSDLRRQGVKIVYATVPAPLFLLEAARKAGGGKVFVSTPDLLLVTLERAVFFSDAPRRYNLEAGWNPSCRHCLLNGSRLSYLKRGVVEPPDLYLDAAVLCDEAGKLDELAKLQTGLAWESVALRMPERRTPEGVSEEAFDYLRIGFETFLDRIKAWGIPIGDSHLEKALRDWNRLAFKVWTLNRAVSKADPQPMGGAGLALVSSLQLLCLGTDPTAAEGALDTLLREVREQIRDQRGILPAGTPKAGFYFTPYLFPEIERAFRENGIATTFSAVFIASATGQAGKRPEDALDRMVEAWLRMPMAAGIQVEARALAETLEKFRPAVMVYGFLGFDRRMGVHSKLLARETEALSGVPVWHLEGDFWNPDAMNLRAVRDRIETLSRTL